MQSAERRRLQDKARRVVARAVRDGRLARLDGSIRCVDCRGPAEGYDHRDYRKPLDVQPVCMDCNIRRGAAEPMDGVHEVWSAPRPELIVATRSIHRRRLKGMSA
jgi:hypothetical protein